MQLIKKSALFALVLSSALICGQQVQAAKPSAAPAQETTLEVKAKLDAFAKSYVARANDTLKNNRQNMSVTKQGKGYVARYTEVDASTMTTEIYPGKGPAANTWATSYILKRYTNAPARPSPRPRPAPSRPRKPAVSAN